MPERNEPEIHVIRFPAAAGAEWRAERQRRAAESRQRYLEYLTEALAAGDPPAAPAERAAQVLDVLTEWSDVESGDPCPCSCHPRLPDSDHHDYGFACVCRQTAEERGRDWAAWEAERDEFWSSPEGRLITAREQAEEHEVDTWLASNPSVTVRSHGGMAPEQWEGTVDGRPFSFRERHDHWHIELDLRPSGRFVRAWVGGDWDDEAGFEQRELDEGDVIADGTTAVAGYGDSPLSRLRFIVGVIRDHAGRQSCAVHSSGRAAAEAALGQPLRWCPACGRDLR